MSILYDIELSNGEIINGCYFIKYLKPIRSGKNHILMYIPYSLEAFNKNHKRLSFDITNINITKIYDEDSGEDLTKLFINKHKQVEKLYEYSLPFPIWRKQVLMD